MRTTQELFDLKGKTALVTGGSRGLGLQMALALGELGAKVVVSSRKQADLDEAVAVLKENGVEAFAIAADLGKEASIDPLVDAALDALEQTDARAAQVVELRFFAGLSLEQVGETLGLARRTIDRDWRFARAFIKARME